MSPTRLLPSSTVVRRWAAALGLALAAAAGQAQTVGAASAYGLDLNFVDDHGAPRALAEWRDRPVVIAMAYGACRSVCSSTLRTLEAVQSAADRKGVAIDVVVVTIDPAEDTPQAWAQYRQSHHLLRPNWTFLSGRPGPTRVLARFLGVRFWNYDEHVMHDFKVLRLGPEGAIAATLEWTHRGVDALL